MPHSYTRYLAAKRSIEDRSLNHQVAQTLRAQLPRGPVQVVEVGGGIGTMVARVLEWWLVSQGDYFLIDGDATFVEHAALWLAEWSRARGSGCVHGDGGVRITGCGTDLRVHMKCARAEVLEPGTVGSPADLLVCNSLLDLVDVPTLLPRLLRLVKPGGLCWLTTNFDGETIFEPGHPHDRILMDVYHRSMDERRRDGEPAGDSRSGRHLFGHLRAVQAEIIAAGSSDWVVFGSDGSYPGDEAYFVEYILHTIELELDGRDVFTPGQVGGWLADRRGQLARGELVYVAHQLDILARRGPVGT